MPGVMESAEYDLFENRDYGEKPLSLDEAIRKSASLRAANPRSFYRVVPGDPDLTWFRIEAIPLEQRYAEFLYRIAGIRARFSRLFR